MSTRKLHFSSCFGLIVPGLLLAAAVNTSNADEYSFLKASGPVKLVVSTVPANGDVNPYGVAVVRRTLGILRQGDVLISNFNNAANLQGTGTTIVQVAPNGGTSQFAQINPGNLPDPCPGGVGLTTALSVLRRGWVIVGSLPSATGTSADAKAGCLIVLDSTGRVVETFSGHGINGPWDMIALDEGDQAFLFVTNVLNGDVTSGSPHVVKRGTVIRLELEVPKQGEGRPRLMTSTTIASGFAETADPAALVIGPTGLGLRQDGTLYVADSLNNRIAAIPQALARTTSAMTGTDLSTGGALNDPLGLAISQEGNIVAANGSDGNLVEITPQGKQIATKTVETATGAGSLFGLAFAADGEGLYFVDDGDNTLKVLRSKDDD